MPPAERASRTGSWVDSQGVERKLAAIMFTDIVGYTALMAESEEKGLRVRARHRELVRPLVERYHGQWIEATGDESLSVRVDVLSRPLAARWEDHADIRRVLIPRGREPFQ